MCKVIVENPSKNVGFIPYNHLDSRENGPFTIDELMAELNQYNIGISTRDIQPEIDYMVKSGMVIRGVETYRRVAML